MIVVLQWPLLEQQRKKAHLTTFNRQHHGMDEPGVCQVPEGSGEQGKLEETSCEIICGTLTTLVVKG